MLETRKLLVAASAGAVLVTALGVTLAVQSSSLPPLASADLEILRQFPPQTVQQLVDSRDVLLCYAAAAPVFVLTVFVALYIGMQTCAIPGTLTLSLLAGALYGTAWGIVLVSVANLTGSSACYTLSSLVGRPLAGRLWPKKLDSFQQQVAKRSCNLTRYVIFLRVTPVPNTFINVTSPIAGVPLMPFALGTLIGCFPNNLMAVKAGAAMGELQSFRDLYDLRLLLTGAVAGLVAVFPTLFERHASGGTPDDSQQSQKILYT